MSFLIDNILRTEPKSNNEICEIQNYSPHFGYNYNSTGHVKTAKEYYGEFYGYDYGKLQMKEHLYTKHVNHRPFWTPYPYLQFPVYPLYQPTYGKRKGGQVRFTTSQTDALEDRFKNHKYLTPEDRHLLAVTLKLSDRQVKTWFQNRRAKWRRSKSISSCSGTSKDIESDAESNNSDLVKENQ